MKNADKTVVALTVNEGIEKASIEHNPSAETDSGWKDSSEAEVAKKHTELFAKGEASCRNWQADDPDNIAEEAFVKLRDLGIPVHHPNFDQKFFGLLRHKRIDAHRRKKVRAKYEPLIQMDYEYHVDAEFSALNNIGLKEALQVAINNLTLNQKQAIHLQFYEDLELPEIAQAMGQPEGTVKSHLHRAKTKLRHQLAGMDLV